jgi:hypothetical protein
MAFNVWRTILPREEPAPAVGLVAAE